MRISVGDRELNVVEAGQGPPLFLVHGLGLSAAWWDDQIRHFAAKWRVLALDLPGFGDSSPAPYPAAAVDAVVDDLEGCRRRLGLERVFAMGHSLGGMVLLKYAATFPDALQAMVLAGTSARFASDTGRKMLEARIAVLEREGVAGMIAKTFDYTAASHFAPGFVERHPDVLDRVRRQFEKVDADAYVRLSRSIMKFDVVDQLGRIRCPTLIMVGEHDNRCPIDDAVLLNTRIGPSWLKIMPDAGHSPMVEAPEAFNHTAERFLELMRDRR
jgi:3-oxoadipate enol-lactonase